ncbi:MAG: hypothetical protein AAF570_21465 [Bacteroidota bacterium]
MKTHYAAVTGALGLALLLPACRLEKDEGKIEKEKTGPGTSQSETKSPQKQDSVESIAEALKGEIELFAVAVRSGKDKESAEAAAEKIRGIASRMKEYASRLAALDIPEESVRQELGKELREHERSIEAKMGDAEDDLQADGEVSEIMSKAVMEFGAKMQEASVVFDEYFAKEE